MTSNLSYNSNIPATNDDPADDQPLMKTNFASISTLVNVDHVGFDASGYGRHNQVTFNTNNSQGAQVDPSSTVFTENGTAAAKPQLKYKNSAATFQLSAVRAWGFFAGNGAFPITPAQSSNVSTITKSGGGQFVVTLSAGAVASSSFAVIVSGQMTSGFGAGAIVGWDSPGFSGGQGSFQINSRALTAASGTDTPLIGFVVLQI